VGYDGNLISITAGSLWLAARQHDFRLKFGSPAVDGAGSPDIGGVDTTEISTMLTTEFGDTDDFAGNPRASGSIGSWDIGPYEGSFAPHNTEAVTVVTSRIGATGVRSVTNGPPVRDYDTLEEWLSRAVPNSLYASNERHIAVLEGELGSDLPTSGVIQIRFHNTDALRYIEITHGAAQRFSAYRPFSGARIQGVGSTDFPSLGQFSPLIEIGSDYTRLTGLGVILIYGGAQKRFGIKVLASDCFMDSVSVAHTGGSADLMYGFDNRGTGNTYINCLVRGSNTSAQGVTQGFRLARASTNIKLLHCIAHSIKGSPSAARGFTIEDNCARIQISGCIATDSDDSDFLGDGTITMSEVLDHCISSDSTAVGTGSIISTTAASLYKDASVNDYRQLSTSPGLDAGSNHTSIFSTDITGKRRFGPFDIGAHEGIFFVESQATPDPVEALYTAVCYQLIRTDGLAFFFTSANQPLIHEGQTYLPASGLSASTRRQDTGLAEHNLEVQGAITSDRITDDDLVAGRFRGAEVRIFEIDHRVPWTDPIVMHQYTLADTTFDSEKWKGDLVGPTHVMDRKVGEAITVSCGLTFGSPECGVDLAPITQIALSVSVVTSGLDRREFTSSVPTAVDDYYGRGLLTFKTGNLTGLSFRIKTFISDVIFLDEATPVPIVAGDTFDLIPGCRKALIRDCITKWTNGPQHGGRAFVPNTDTGLETPTR